METSFSNLDEALKSPEAVLELNLEDQDLKTLPDSIATLVNLERLSLARNIGLALPEALWSLATLKYLDAHCIKMLRIPEGLGRLVSLEVLKLGDLFEELPASMQMLRNLRRLELDGVGKLQFLPDWLWELPSLSEFILFNGRHIRGLKESLSRVQHLSILDLSCEVPLQAMPEQAGGLVHLNELRLQDTQIDRIPDWIGDLCNLKELSLEDNPDLKELPDALGNLRRLRYLRVARSGGGMRFPNRLGQLENLEALDLRSCALPEFPRWILTLKNLRSLSMNVESMKEIPREIGELSNLKELDLVASPEIENQHDIIASWLPEGCTLEM